MGLNERYTGQHPDAQKFTVAFWCLLPAQSSSKSVLQEAPVPHGILEGPGYDLLFEIWGIAKTSLSAAVAFVPLSMRQCTLSGKALDARTQTREDSTDLTQLCDLG